MFRGSWIFCLVALLFFASAALAHGAAMVVYIDESGGLKGVMHPDAYDPESAIAALANPIPDPATGAVLSSAVPSGTRLLGLSVDGETTIVNFSSEIIAALDEVKLINIHKQVSLTLYQFGMSRNIKLQADGKGLSDYLPPSPIVYPQPKAAQTPEGREIVGSLAGHSITLSPGHGRRWNGSAWNTQRPVYCSPLSQEDYHNLENSLYLKRFLENDGMTVNMVRCVDKNYGNHYTGAAWWQMAAYLWLQNVGYPCTVYSGYSGDCTTGSGADESSDDVRSRPLASDYDNTDIYISLHTNGFQGDCYGGCPTGTDTYYDCGTEHAAWCTVSTNLANAVHDSLINTIRTGVPVSDWADRGKHNSDGAYGEIRVPDRAAILIELAFHDTCDRDALYLGDNFFRSASMWGIYNGVCSYFGTTPTWGFYSCEYVSDTIPATMEAGHQYEVSVTYRNKGVLWMEAKQFRLGAVGDYDPLTTSNRQYITGEVDTDGTCTFTFTLTAPNSGGTYVTDWQMVREGVTWFGPITSKTVEVSGAPDTEPPTVPGDPTVESISMSEIYLDWSPSTDNVGVTGYKIYRNGSFAYTTSATEYTDTGLSSNTMYTYTVTAVDGVANESAHSEPAAAITHVVVWQDGFPDLGNWPADTVADGTIRGGVYYASGHGLYTGAGSAQMSMGSSDLNGCWNYRPFAEPFTTGAFNCWIYDQASGVCRQGVHVRGMNGTATAFAAFLGAYPDAPGSTTKFSGAVYDGSTWSWAAQIAPRTVNWRDLRILVGASQIGFYVDGLKKGSLPRPTSADAFGITRVNIGYDRNVKWAAWYDDAQFTAPPPVPPVAAAATALSTASIRWNFADKSNNESSFSLQDSGHAVKATAQKNASYADEMGLLPNTQYTRHIHARNGTLEGPASNEASAYTLSVAPTGVNVTCDRPASTWLATDDFTFTAVGGFGAGTVQYYKYAWDQSASHAWTGTEAVWSSGDLPLTATSPGEWFLHVKGFNGDDAENGVLTLGPYRHAPAASSVAAAKALADETPVSIGGAVVTANFGSAIYIEDADGTSGIRVESAGPAVGTSAGVSGIIRSVDGERRIEDAVVTAGAAEPIPPIRLFGNKGIGGGSLNAHTPGVEGGIGVNNIGLLAATGGIVTHSGSGFIYIDDGAGLSDGSGYTGLRVDISHLANPPEIGKFVLLRGIVSTQIIGGKTAPRFAPRSDADATIYGLP
ncbi:MAG: N-acetylmuramoyl-L-alanine amidase [Armatimonadetes bacterium]|nr:N-acetylmuramoyl-L-alanine amidase [Armatimonadota bacterium]